MADESGVDVEGDHSDHDMSPISPHPKSQRPMMRPPGPIGMPPQFRASMRPMPPMGYRGPPMRGPRPMPMGMRGPPMRSPGFRGPRPFDGPPRPFDGPHQFDGPPRGPTQRFQGHLPIRYPHNMTDELDEEMPEGYFESEDDFQDDGPPMSSGIRPRGSMINGPPRPGYGPPFMNGPRQMMNGGSPMGGPPMGQRNNGPQEMRPQGYGPPGFGPPRQNHPSGAPPQGPPQNYMPPHRGAPPLGVPPRFPPHSPDKHYDGMPPMGMPPNGPTGMPLGPPPHLVQSPNQYGVPPGVPPPHNGPNFDPSSGMLHSQPSDNSSQQHPSLFQGVPPGGPCPTSQSQMSQDGQTLGPGDMSSGSMGQPLMIPPSGPPPGGFGGPMPPPYGPPPGMFQPGMPMGAGPPPFMTMGFPPGVSVNAMQPVMMPNGHMGMYSTPPPVSSSTACYPSGNIQGMGPPVVAATHSFLQGHHGSSNIKEDIWVENLASEGKFYYYNMRTRETRWDRPESVTILRQGEVEKDTSNASKTTTSSMHSAQPVVQPLPPAAVSVSVKPPDAAAWTEYRSPEGKCYYHNSHTGETTWEKPKAVIDWESGSLSKSSDAPESSQEAKEKESSNNSELKAQDRSFEKKSETFQEIIDEKTKEPSQETPKSESAEKMQEKDTSRPISSTAVSGTPWCVVWTGDGRVFFFNPSQRTSVWETPDDLKGRADVEKLLEKPPSNDKSVELTAEKVDETKSQESIAAGTEISDRIEEHPVKRIKLDNEVSPVQVEQYIKPSNASNLPKTNNAEPMIIEEEKNQIGDNIALGKEAAKEAVARATREQAVLPLDVRISQFREMLIDNQVSAFSTWEKELHKIVFDSRYLLLNSKERKQTFEAFIKERAEDERREKKSKLKEKKERFFELLTEANLSSKSSFSDISPKYTKDERFKAIEKTREREALFQEFITELRRREKEKHNVKEKTKTGFINLLKEHKSLTRYTHWSDFKKKIESDSRYRAVESSSRREDWFREFCRKLDESSSREDSETRKEREKRDRQEASLRARKKEVEEAHSNSMRERDRERDSHMRSEAEVNFNTLLVDLFKADSSLTWKEAKKILSKDSRWGTIKDVIPRSEREGFFKIHINNLNKKTKEVFYKILNECDLLELTTTWKELKKILKEDSRFQKIISNEKKWESEYTNWMVEREAKSKKEFLDLLKEKSSIILNAKRQSSEEDTFLDDILSTLQEDKRFKALECIQSQRSALLEDYLERLSEAEPISNTRDSSRR